MILFVLFLFFFSLKKKIVIITIFFYRKGIIEGFCQILRADQTAKCIMINGCSFEFIGDYMKLFEDCFNRSVFPGLNSSALSIIHSSLRSRFQFLSREMSKFQNISQTSQTLLHRYVLCLFLQKLNWMVGSLRPNRALCTLVSIIISFRVGVVFLNYSENTYANNTLAYRHRHLP